MVQESLTQELIRRGFVNQTTFKSMKDLDSTKRTFYLGVDPSAASMTIGNLASIMMVRTFIRHGHKAILLIGGATGMIGDPDGKNEERELKPLEEIEQNKKSKHQYHGKHGKPDFRLKRKFHKQIILKRFLSFDGNNSRVFQLIAGVNNSNRARIL